MLHILSVSVQSLLNTAPLQLVSKLSEDNQCSVATALYLSLCHKIDKDMITIHLFRTHFVKIFNLFNYSQNYDLGWDFDIGVSQINLISGSGSTHCQYIFYNLNIMTVRAHRAMLRCQPVSQAHLCVMRKLGQETNFLGSVNLGLKNCPYNAVPPWR